MHEKQSAVQFRDIVADDSEGKAVSHYRLVSYVKKFGATTFTRMYTKEQLTKRSLAYDVEVGSRANKTTLSTSLIPVLQSCVRVPNLCFLNEYQALARADDNLQRVVLRISRRNQLKSVIYGVWSEYAYVYLDTSQRIERSQHTVKSLPRIYKLT